MEGTRPDRLVVVAGTGTEVGKTWVATRLLEGLVARSAAVAARKPAQSGAAEDDPSLSDASLLAQASGEQPEEVCPPSRWYPVAFAPPMAAEALGRPGFTIAQLVDEIAWPTHWTGAGEPRIVLVETAGGVRSPQADDGDVVDLIRSLVPEVVVLVADAGLGTINAVRLSADALTGSGAFGRDRLVVVLNRYDPACDLHRRNRSWLADRDGLDVFEAPGDLRALTDRVLT